MWNAQCYEFVVEPENVVPAGLEPIAFVKPLAMPFCHHFLLAEMAVDYPEVVLHPLVPLGPGRIVILYRNVAGKSVPEEALHRQLIDYVEIIIEIYEMLAEARYSVNVTLDYHRVEGWKILLRNEILVPHYVELRIVSIQP